MNQMKAIFLILLISIVSSSRLEMEMKNKEFFKNLKRGYDSIKGGFIQATAKVLLAPVLFAIRFGGQVIICPLIRVTTRLLYGAQALLSGHREQYDRTIERMLAVDAGVCGAVDKTITTTADIVIAPIAVLDVAKEALREALRLLTIVINPFELYRIIKDNLKKEENVDLDENTAGYVDEDN